MTARLAFTLKLPAHLHEHPPNVLRGHSADTPPLGSASYCSNLLERLERATGIEPATRSLGSYCSTTELHPRRPSHNTALRRPKAVAAERPRHNVKACE